MFYRVSLLKNFLIFSATFLHVCLRAARTASAAALGVGPQARWSGADADWTSTADRRVPAGRRAADTRLLRRPTTSRNPARRRRRQRLAVTAASRLRQYPVHSQFCNGAIITDRITLAGKVMRSVVSVRLFPLYL